jgi:trehalose 6-phosphate synthase
VRLGAFPISIDSHALDEMAAGPEVKKRAQQLRADLGDPERIVLGVDRLDYTKGIDVRLRAFEELLEEGKIDDNTVMIQIATPSRERVEHYTRMRNDIEQAVGRINGAHSRVGHPVLHYLHQSMPRDDLVAFFAAADVMLVTPLRDGMNLVAKEYVACRHDNGGVLVLSEFAGAAIELKDAILVNPHDTDGVKNALEAALRMNPSEARRRMRAMRRQVLTHDVDRWARTFLDALGLPPASEDSG